MIVKAKDAKKREFLGVSFDVLAVGDKSMVTRMNYKAGNHVGFHSHPNEQSGYVISGKIQIKFEKYNEILQPGDSYSIARGVKHSMDALEDSIVIDFFVPPRKDYL